MYETVQFETFDYWIRRICDFANFRQEFEKIYELTRAVKGKLSVSV